MTINEFKKKYMRFYRALYSTLTVVGNDSEKLYAVFSIMRYGSQIYYGSGVWKSIHRDAAVAAMDSCVKNHVLNDSIYQVAIEFFDLCLEGYDIEDGKEVQDLSDWELEDIRRRMNSEASSEDA